MELEELNVSITAIQGEIQAFKEVYNERAEQNTEKFNNLETSIKDIDTKVDQLLIREARREGEFKAAKKIAIILATTVSLLISAAERILAYMQ